MHEKMFDLSSFEQLYTENNSPDENSWLGIFELPKNNIHLVDGNLINCDNYFIFRHLLQDVKDSLVPASQMWGILVFLEFMKKFNLKFGPHAKILRVWTSSQTKNKQFEDITSSSAKQ